MTNIKSIILVGCHNELEGVLKVAGSHIH